MWLDKFKNKIDRVVFENYTFRFSSICSSVAIVVLVYMLAFKIESQKTVVVPPFVTFKEFWVSGNNVSESYLEMVADGIVFNVLSIAPERKPNTEFLLAMTPPEYFNQVRSAIDTQIRFIQNNAISQVFYTNGYNTKEKGLLKVTGILKQYVGDKKIESAMYTLEIGYVVKADRFWIKSIQLRKEGEKASNTIEEEGR